MLLSSYKVHIQRMASLLEIIPAWKLRRQLCWVMRNIWSSVNPSPQHYIGTNCPCIVPMLLKSIGITINTSTICLKVMSQTMNIGVWGFLTLCCNMDTTYKQSSCSNIFFCSLPSQVVCIISGGYTRSDFNHIFSATMTYLPSKILQMHKWYIFSS